MDMSKIAKRRGQEKRTTFQLTQQGSDDLNCLMKDFGFKHKDIFENIIAEDELSISKLIVGASKSNIKDSSLYEIKRTMVIHEIDLNSLNKLSRKNEINRNALVDNGIRFLASLMRNHEKQSIEKYKTALGLIENIYADMERAEQKSSRLLEKGDPYLEQITDVTVMMMNLVHGLQEKINSANTEKSK